MGRPIDNIVGKRFGKLIVVKFNGKNNKGYLEWLCLCDCGNEHATVGSDLKKGCVNSCGCYRREYMRNKSTKHGMSITPEGNAYYSMKKRCNNKSHKAYSIYGGRGIKVCERWEESFESFYHDMGNRPEGMSLDRIDVNGNYEPNNCKWSTDKEQSNNRRSNRIIEYKGVALNESEWAKKLGISVQALCYRLNKWNDKDKIFTSGKFRKRG